MLDSQILKVCTQVNWVKGLARTLSQCAIGLR